MIVFLRSDLADVGVNTDDMKVLLKLLWLFSERFLLLYGEHLAGN